jgi:hypothetical protein
MNNKKNHFISRKVLAAKYNLHPDTLKAMLESEEGYQGSVVEWHYKEKRRLFSPAAVRWIEAKFEGFADKSEVTLQQTCKQCGRNVA